MLPFYSLTKEKLAKIFQDNLGIEKAHLHARNAFLRVYKGNLKWNLPQTVLNWLSHSVDYDTGITISHCEKSEHDGSIKFILKLYDQQLIETVLIPERGHYTLCVSSQVGCQRACRFCQTGRMGLKRNLYAHEIIGQYLCVSSWLKENTNEKPAIVTNIVFMGMGEPLDNSKNVKDSIQIFCDPHSFFLSHNKITVSTVGILSELPSFLENCPASLAISLHNPLDAMRSKIMPVNLENPIGQVIEILKRYPRTYLFQYTLIRGVNDSEQHAEKIKDLLTGVHAKVNIIPLNEHKGTAYRRPSTNHVFQFQQKLKALGLVATVRLSKGRDIQAGCGQLISQVQEKESKSE